MKWSLIRCVLIEDEPLSSERLHRLLLQADEHVVVVAKLESVAQARQWFDNAEPVDLIFADVQLGDGLFFEISSAIPAFIPVVLTTSYDVTSSQAFSYQAFDCLLKPIKRTDLQVVIGRFRDRQLTADTPALPGRIKSFFSKLVGGKVFNPR